MNLSNNQVNNTRLGNRSFGNNQRGFNLIELMVAMVLGVFLIAGALRIYTQSQAALLVSEQTARLQESARYAISLIEKDIRSADLWGMTNRANDIAGRGEEGTPPLLYNVQNGCTMNWAVNLNVAIEGSNNTNNYGSPCVPPAQYQANTDVLVLRHAESEDIPTANLQAGQIYVRSNSNSGAIFVGNNQPPGIATNGVTTRLTSIAYWVSRRSDNDSTVPSLRRSYLTSDGVNPEVVSEEVIRGVEDFQVQYGIDTTGDSSVNSYVDFDDVADPTSVIVARVWIRVRSENPELGFDDNSSYIYADGSYSAATSANDDDSDYRRLLLTKTVEIRNRRASSIIAAAGP